MMATPAATADATSERIATLMTPARSRARSRRERTHRRTIASIQAATAIARPRAGSPITPTSAQPSVVLITTARIAAATGVLVSCRA